MLQYNTNLFIWQPSAGLKEKQSSVVKCYYMYVCYIFNEYQFFVI